MTGSEIRALREALGWTQVQLAAACHVSPSAIYKWEARKDETVRFSYLEKVGIVTLFRELAPLPDELLNETS